MAYRREGTCQHQAPAVEAFTGPFIPSLMQ